MPDRRFVSVGLIGGAPLRVSVAPEIPFPLGGAAHLEASTGSSHGDDHERASLVPTDRPVPRPKYQPDTNVIVMCTTVTLCLLITAVVALVVAIWVRVDSLTTDATEVAIPFITSGLVKTVSILNSTERAATHANHIAAAADFASGVSIPALLGMLNKTQAMVNELAHFVTAPSVSIGIGSGGR